MKTLTIALAVTAATSLASLSSSCEPTPQVFRIAGSPASSSTHNILFLGAGFRTDDQLKTYRAAAHALADKLLTDASMPYSSYAANLSFWRIDVRSSTGIDTSKCPGSMSTLKATPCAHAEVTAPPPSAAPGALETINPSGDAEMSEDLGVRLCYSETTDPGSCLVLWADDDGQRIAADLASYAPNVDTVVILANTTVWAGATSQDVLSGGQSLVVIGVPEDASGAADGFNLIAHELGHTLGLADEYSTGYGVSSVPSSTYGNVWQPTDPCYAPALDSHVVAPTGATTTIPWAALLACETPLDPKLDCDYDTDVTDYGCPRVYWPQHSLPKCYLASHGVDAACLDYVGLFEGAFYMSEGCYRPAWNCKMRDSSANFCAVCDAWIRNFFECNYLHSKPC